MKTKSKRIIALSFAVIIVALLAAMPLIAGRDTDEEGPKASILSGSVAVGDINSELIGGGSLSEEDAAIITVPAAVKITEFFVSNGDSVTEGDPIASVDRVTVMKAISLVQETLEYLSEEIDNASDFVSEENVKALAGGTVKTVYAEEGESVQSVMLEHGALAVLSLDGLMAVTFESDSDLPAGTVVDVTFYDGSTAEGKIVKNLMGEMTITLEDDDYLAGDKVSITAKNGSEIGAGELYIYSPWNATAYAGTVKSINVSEGETLNAGRNLMVLSDVGYSALYRQLIGQRQEYEELMLELFRMYQTEMLTAPCDGVVSGVDKNSSQLLSDKGIGYVISFLANSPDGSESLYSNYVGQIVSVSEGSWEININPQPLAIEDYTVLDGVPMDTSAMTQSVSHSISASPVYTLSDGAWIQFTSDSVSAGDILLFATDGNGLLVWSVLLQRASLPDNPDNPDDPDQPDDPNVPGDSDFPGGNGTPGGNMVPSGGNWGGFSGGMMEQETEFELYSLDMADIASVTPQDEVTLEITVDELDVNMLTVGMTAQVKIDALGGEKYEAVITAIGNIGSNNGGSSKYVVELTMPRAENMLGGMNATATIVVSTVSGVLTLPADALNEEGNVTYVYTSFDEETQTLLNPVSVKIGESDGETVEILEGLEEGQTYYYAYYDTLEISFTPDFGGGFMFG